MELICSTCLQKLPLSQFAVRKDRGTYYKRCKKCSSQAARLWEKQNPTKVKKTKKQSREKHKERHQEYNQSYYQANKETLKQKRRVSTQRKVYDREYERKQIAQMSDNYLIDLISLNGRILNRNEVTLDMIELKRKQLKLIRNVKKQSNKNTDGECN